MNFEWSSTDHWHGHIRKNTEMLSFAYWYYFCRFDSCSRTTKKNIYLHCLIYCLFIAFTTNRNGLKQMFIGPFGLSNPKMDFLLLLHYTHNRYQIPIECYVCCYVCLFCYFFSCCWCVVAANLHATFFCWYLYTVLAVCVTVNHRACDRYFCFSYARRVYTIQLASFMQ